MEDSVSDPKPASVSPDSHHRLAGPGRAAVRRSDRKSWLLVPKDRLRRARLPLGLYIELGRKDAPRDHSLTTEPGVGPTRLPVPVPPVSPGAGAVAGGLAALAGTLGFLMGSGGSTLAFAPAIDTFSDLALALAAVWVTLSVFLTAEGGLLGDSIQGTTNLVWMRRGLPEVEPVCWRLGIPVSVAVLALILPAAGLAAALGWHELAPAVSGGAAVGAVVYTLQALYPLRPGPGARCLEALTGLEDLPTQLRWALVERFLPAPGGLTVGGSRTMAVAALALAGWVAGTGQVLHTLSATPVAGLTPAGSLWRGLATTALVLWAAWLVTHMVGLFLAAWRLGSDTALEPLEPPPEVQSSWAEENPLSRHVKGLRHAPWKWGVARRGSLLIEYGAETRDFYWVARGMVHVVGRTENGDPVLLTTVRAGLGLGEVALLDDGGRTADIIAAEDTVVAILERDDFTASVDAQEGERFREVVLASQALARTPTLWGLSPDARSRWLSNGRPERYEVGETVVAQDERRAWVGLVVKGRLAVERDDRPLATLEPDTVFGEMAYLSGNPRSATIRAQEPTLVWRWEPEWLDRELVEAGAADELRELAEERARDSR